MEATSDDGTNYYWYINHLARILTIVRNVKPVGNPDTRATKAYMNENLKATGSWINARPRTPVITSESAKSNEQQ